MRYWRSGVISHQVCNHEILWIWRNMKYAVMRYCGSVMIHFVELDHSEQSDQQDQSGYTSASSDRFRSCLLHSVTKCTHFCEFPPEKCILRRGQRHKNGENGT